MRIEKEADVLLGTPRVGQGKDTFLNSVREHLEYSSTNPNGLTVDIIEPSRASLPTRAIWSIINRFYIESANPGKIQDIYSSIRSNNGNGGLVTEWANREIARALNKSGKTYLAFHGLFGKGVERYFAEGDIWPEPRAADSQTTAFVPMEETKIKLENFGETKETIVAGFIVPKALKDPQRVEERIAKFKDGGPINIGFLLTGQVAHEHMKILHQILPQMKPWIKEGRAKLTVYMWNNQNKAKETFSHAKELNLDPYLGKEYIPDNSHPVQIYWNPDPDRAVQNSFAIGAAADKLITPLGERIPWLAYVSTIPLPAIGGNLKMDANTQWAEHNGLVGSHLQLLDIAGALEKDFANDAEKIKTHYDRVGHVFEAGAKLNGAERIANTIIKRVRSKS